MVAPSARAFFTMSTVLASMFVFSITGLTALCSVPPSEVKSFWYSINTTAVSCGFMEASFWMGCDANAEELLVVSS